MAPKRAPQKVAVKPKPPAHFKRTREMATEARETFGAVRWLAGVFILAGSLMYSFYYLKPAADQYDKLYLDKFERAGGEGHTHFMVVDPEFLNNRTLQSYAAKRLCTENNHLDYCDVYIFGDRKDVPEHLPIIRGSTNVVGMYKIKNDEIEFRVLHDGGFNPIVGSRVSQKSKSE